MKTLLKLVDAILLDSSECHLHYYEFKYSLNIFLFFYIFLSFLTLNEIIFPKFRLFEVDYFLPNLLESFGSKKLAN